MKLHHILLTTSLAFTGAAYAADEASDTEADRQSQVLQELDTEMGEAEGTEQAFQALDTDGDGVISAAEAEQDNHLNAVFRDVDDDDDGQVSSEEFSEWKGGFVD